MQTITNENTSVLAKKCSEAIHNVGFPDLATRRLFEGLIKATAGVDHAMQGISEQK